MLDSFPAKTEHNEHVHAYPVAADGNVPPTQGKVVKNTPASPRSGIALDAARNLYIANPAANSVSVYAAGSTGFANPQRTIKGRRTGLDAPAALAVDADGDVYVANEAGESVTVYGPTAAGDAAPVQSISGSSTGLSNPQSIAVDVSGNIYVLGITDLCNVTCGSVTVFAAGSNGNVAPIRTITGSNTGMNGPLTPEGLALDTGGNVYVLSDACCFGDPAPTVTTYAAGSNGNVAPIATLTGVYTKMQTVTSVALDAAANIYVANQNLNDPYCRGTVTVYPADSNGDVSPTQIISGGKTQLCAPIGIAVR